MTWYFNNEPIEDIDPKYVGFVYLITNLVTGKRYIGKKLAKFSKTTTKTVTLKNGTKKKKKIRSKTDSDWKTYWSSSDELKTDIANLGEHNFKRTIIHLCPSKGVTNYLEAKEQMLHAVLEDSNAWYNSWIQCKVNKSHLRPLRNA